MYAESEEGLGLFACFRLWASSTSGSMFDVEGSGWDDDMLAMGCVDASCSTLSSADVAGVLHKEVSFFLVNI